MNKATIVTKLHEIIDYHLLGAGTWPADRESLTAFWKIVREFGLEEDVPANPGATRSTALGKELNLELMMVFVGAYDLLDVALNLVSNEYLDEKEADALWSMSEIQFERVLHRYVLRAYLDFCNRSKLLN